MRECMYVYWTKPGPGHLATDFWTSLGGVVHAQAPISWLLFICLTAGMAVCITSVTICYFTCPIPFESGNFLTYISYSVLRAQRSCLLLFYLIYLHPERCAPAATRSGHQVSLLFREAQTDRNVYIDHNVLHIYKT